MRSRLIDENNSLTQVLVKPLYFGIGVNIILPAALLFVCYYFTNHGLVDNSIGDLANPLFYIFAVAAVAQAGFAVYWHRRRMRLPMIRHNETFDADFTAAIVRRSKPVFLLVASISIWGYLYFLLTGRFSETVFFVVFSFIVFQIVRPRPGSMRRLLEHQEKLADNGEFLAQGSHHIVK